MPGRARKEARSPSSGPTAVAFIWRFVGMANSARNARRGSSPGAGLKMSAADDMDSRVQGSAALLVLSFTLLSIYAPSQSADE